MTEHGKLIDADALIEFIENRYEITWKDDYEGGIKDACVDILEKIENMPTIEPERKKGKWKDEDCHAATYKYCCSECKAHHRAMYDYCPSCGADMRGEQE